MEDCNIGLNMTHLVYLILDHLFCGGLHQFEDLLIGLGERLRSAIDDDRLVEEPQLVPDETKSSENSQQVEHVSAGQQILDHSGIKQKDCYS